MTPRPHNPRLTTVQTWDGGPQTHPTQFDAVLSLLESLTPAELNDLKMNAIHREQKRRQGITGPSQPSKPEKVGD